MIGPPGGQDLLEPAHPLAGRGHSLCPYTRARRGTARRTDRSGPCSLRCPWTSHAQSVSQSERGMTRPSTAHGSCGGCPSGRGWPRRACTSSHLRLWCFHTHTGWDAPHGFRVDDTTVLWLSLCTRTVRPEFSARSVHASPEGKENLRALFCLSLLD